MSFKQELVSLIKLLVLLTLTACTGGKSNLESLFLGGVRLESATSAITVSSTVATTGIPITVTLTTRDQNGNIFKSPTALSIIFSTVDGNSIGGFGTVTDHGDGTYTSDFVALSAGTPIKIKAVLDANTSLVSSDEIAVVGGTFSLSHSYVDLSATTVAAGGTVNVTLFTKDASNAPVATGGLPVTFALGTSGTSSGTFDAVVDNNDGTYSSVFHATTAGTIVNVIGKIATLPLTSAAPQVTVTAGPPTVFTISSGDNQNKTVGASLNSDFVVLAKDAFDNVVPSLTVNWAITAGGGSLTAASSTTSAAGLASNHLTLGTIAGTNTVTATIASTALMLTFTATGTVGVPANIAVSSGNNQSLTVASTAAPFEVLVTDSYNNVISNVTLDWAITTSGGNLSAASSTTNTSGVAATTLTLKTTAGTTTVKATVRGYASLNLNFTTTGLADTTIASLAWVTNPDTSYTASNSSAMTGFSLKLLDTYGNTILSDSATTATLSLTTGTSGLAGTLTQTAVSGVISFNDITYTKAEAIVLKATENSSGNNRTVSSATITVAPNVADATNSTITSSAGTVANDGGVAITLTFKLVDAYGNIRPNSPVVFASTGTGNTLVQPSNTDSTGQTTGTIKSTIAETKTISFSTPVIGTTLNIAFATPSLAIAASSAAKGSTMTFTVTQSVVAGSDVSFNYATSNGTALSGTNYTASSGTKTIAAGQTSTTFTVPTLSTDTDDADLTFTAAISGVSGSTATIGTANATGTVKDTSWIYNLSSCSLPAGVTFTRNSTAGTYFDSSGIMQTIGVTNTPRFDYDPSTNTCRGLLLEPATTNSMLYSTTFNAASWTLTNATKNAVGNPTGLDGSTTNVIRLIENGTAGIHGISQVLVNPAAYTSLNISVYAKLPAAGSARNYLEVAIGDSSALTNSCKSVFNLALGTNTANTISGTAGELNAGATYDAGTGVITPIANGWYRISVYCNMGVASNAYVALNLMNVASGSSSYSGTTNYLYLWAPQAEWNQSYPTSYLPVTSTTVRSRPAETLSVDNFATWFNYSNMTTSVDFSRAAVEDATSVQSLFLFRIDNGSSTANSFQGKITGSARKAAFYGSKASVGSSGLAQVDLSLATPYLINQYISSYANDGATVYQSVNGVLSSAGSLPAGNLPASASLSRLAYVASVPTYFRRLVYRRQALDNSKLTVLTSTYLPSTSSTTIAATGPTTADGTAVATITVTLKNAAGLGLPGITPTISVTGGTGNAISSCTASNSAGVSACSLTSTSTGVKALTITSPANMTSVTGSATFN
jgi:hypothetical protein